MRTLVQGSLGVCLMFSGCASVPKLQTEIGLLRISDIVDNIRCDLKNGRDGDSKSRRGPAAFLAEDPGWSAAIELSLNVVAESNGNIAGGNEVPYIPQTMTLALATDVTGTADRLVGYKFTVGLGSEDEIVCDTTTVESRRKHNSRLVGDLGIGVWLAQLQDAYAETRTKPDSASYVLQFTLLQKADGSVKIAKIPFNTAQGSLGFTLKGSWKDVNKISIAFAPKQTQAPPKAAPVPKRATKLLPGQEPKKPTPPPPPVDPDSRNKVLQDLQFLLLQQNLQE